MNWLKELRLKYNLTQKQLAKETNINIFTIQNIEQDKRKGSKETLDKLNEYFDKLKKTK
jgi:transcriptional regulator with XRE-family HTH domain